MTYEILAENGESSYESRFENMLLVMDITNATGKKSDVIEASKKSFGRP